MTELRAASRRDWQIFERLARSEGWRVPQRELQLLQGPFEEAVQVLGDGDIFCGLISALTHQKSGWIGNLLVPKKLRRRGYGRRLFEAALDELEDRRVVSTWLTASTDGQPLYTGYGFQVVGEIERWVLPVGQAGERGSEDSAVAWTSLRQSDRSIWGEARDGLLEGLAPVARAFAHQDATALLQTDLHLQILGPWYSANMCPRSNRQLLQEVLEARNPKLELVVDLLSASPLKSLLGASGFVCKGRNALMVRGNPQEVELQSMVSLASLGSIG